MALKNKELEEYLETMYRKKQKGEKITTGEIAKELSISPASVSEMFKKLEKRGYIKYTPYKKVELTKEGEKIGASILRKHRLVEDFLEIFGVKREKAHEEACALEHAVSNAAEKAFERAIKNTKNAKPLSTLKEGQKGKILYVIGGVMANKRIEELGLTRGTIVKVIRTSKYGCPISLLVRDSELAIGRGIAEKIYVEVIE